MRYGVISDIHGNLEALQAVLAALSKDRIDAYLLVGDVVGYGADPKACLSLVKSLKADALIAGNHDWAVLGLTDVIYFNPIARAAVVWTKEVLAESEAEYLKSFKMVHNSDNFTLVHGTLNKPEDFNYILDYDSAYPTILLMDTPVCFVGHSHVAGIFYSEGELEGEEIRFTKGPKVNIERDKKYIVNAGSVGQPRDMDPRAAYVIYDDEARTIEIKRVEYDIKAAQKKIIEAGLPKELALRLAEGR